MNLLLDTHTLIWFFESDIRLSEYAKALIENPDNQIFLSAASIWEMVIKNSIGKLALSRPIKEIVAHIQKNGIRVIDITASHALGVSKLPFHHRDPFDRILLAQSLHLGLSVVSKDAIFDQYIENRLW